MPPTDRPAPAPRASARRAPATPVKIPAAGPPVRKIAPYAVAIVIIGVLAFLVRTPRFAVVGAAAIVGVALLALGWLALDGRVNLPKDDGLRTWAPLVTALVLAAAAVPFGLTLFPPHARGEVTLNAHGDSASVEVTGLANTVWLTVSGRFVNTATGTANYVLTVTRSGGASERIDGVFRPHAGGPVPERHVLTLAGPGRYTLQLEQTSDAVALPLHVALSTRPYSTVWLVLMYIALAALVLALDTMIARRGIEPVYAAAMLLPLAAAVYFQRNPATDTPGSDLLAAGIVGVIAGGIGGELIGRAVRMIGRK